MDKLREKERVALYDKISGYLKHRLDYMLSNEGKWMGTEIAETYGFPINRQAEIRKPYKYPERRISRPLLKKLVGGGFMTTQELLDNLDLNEKEKNHIGKLAVYEETGLHERLLKFRAANIKVSDALDEFERSHPQYFK